MHMIKICFPAGCYGHYLAQCLWYFTDISDSNVEDFVFDADGGSHTFRQNFQARNHIQIGHFSYKTSGQNHLATLNVAPGDQLVTIMPVETHWLDYFNNQFEKQAKKHFVSYLDGMISLHEIETKLRDHWQYQHGINSNIPQWIKRELVSFYIQDMLDHGYARDHCNLPGSIKVPTTMFFTDFAERFKSLCQDLGLRITTSDVEITTHNSKFQTLQRHHDSQNRCMRWVDDVLQDRASTYQALTLFDEAYMQSALRLRNFEIRCDGLDQFPECSTTMQTLIWQK